MSEETNDTSKAVWFLAGIAIGATVALLFAPASGEETRRRIGAKAVEGKDALAETGREILDKGRDLYDKGRKIADEASEMFDRGRRLVQS
jgi:gas vesicle protein